MASVSSSQDQPRRKFSRPPVKLACLSCRSLRTRCDGQERCANCISRGATCCYTPSRRGGPRVHKRKAKNTAATQQNEPQSERSNEKNALEPSADLNFTEDAWFNQLVSLGDPGAGLCNVEMPIAEIENIFDSIFAPQLEREKQLPGVTPAPAEIVQLYGSDQDILDAYYVFIHPYYPILPPPVRLPVVNRPLTADRSSSFEPSSPLSLAISALLVLIPHPQEQNPSRLEYVRLRRDYAQSFAQSALEAVEVDSELLHSSSDPANALSEGTPQFNREPFHPKVPVSLESVLALNLLSVYEYAQRGNMAKMRNRAGQALTAAMSMSLHEATENDEFTEARRRAWWMTYATACQGSIVSNTPAVFDVYDRRFVTSYPTFLSDLEGWSFFIQAQQAILAATKFVHDLYKALKSWSDMSWIPQRMLELDNQIETLLSQKGPQSLSQLSAMAPVDASESVVAKAMRSIAEIKLHSARIKTHRFCAFSDIPIFLKRHCDLRAACDPAAAAAAAAAATAAKDRCTCQGLPLESASLPASNTTPIPSSPPDYCYHTCTSLLSAADLGLRFPFSPHASSKICLHSALNIVSLLENLPYPNPNSSIISPYTTTPPRLSDASSVEIPRTMPTFACCAMQSSYALLMLCFKARSCAVQQKKGTGTPFAFSGGDEGETDEPHLLLNGFMNDLYQSLQLLIRALANYSIAFEALKGMRDEVSRVVEYTFS